MLVGDKARLEINNVNFAPFVVFQAVLIVGILVPESSPGGLLEFPTSHLEVVCFGCDDP